MPSLEDPRFLAMEGEIVDPFDSLDAMIKHEDLQKFVLFKTHYRKYMDVSVAYEDVMSRLESYEDELDHAKSQEMKALEDLETMRTLLREKDVILQKKEDELFAADEKITQLECDLDEERTRGLKLKSDLASLVEEKQSLVKQCQTALREKNDVQLRFQVEKSKEGNLEPQTLSSIGALKDSPTLQCGHTKCINVALGRI
ncbi:unnamed protein product [Notodromas monacha]|uniref:Uncharacterized protein n=1 Tax=Notodromas monacha TaxID=399045 RepID=A0A7R9BU10_9CRUS|nr:unnamed protein product [Notodromas monacha]CAG0920181.1 unnamed protein product [Notodromas monacha]